MSNTTDPAFLAAWEPHRAAIRPAECNYADPCWVTAPYDAIAASSKTPRCTGCGAAIVPVDRRRLKGFWPEPVAAIIAGGKR